MIRRCPVKKNAVPSNLAIGVHVHAEPELLAATLASLSANSGRSFSLLLLGDGADAPTTAALEVLKHVPQSNTPSSQGGAACFNRLVRHSRADIYVLLESGAQVAPGWLVPMLGALQLHPHCGLVGPSTNRSWNEQCIFPGGTADAKHLEQTSVIASRRYGGTCRTLEPLHSLGDFCYMVRRDVIDAIGDADESYGTGPCWEMDYNIRAFRAGYQAYWACAAYVHRAPASARRKALELSAFEASRRLYQDKFCGLRLQGMKTDVRDHCRGTVCGNFAPAKMISVRHPSERSEAPQPEEAAPRVDAGRTRGLHKSLPLVSCIMPTYNRRAFVPRALDYFFSQDYPNLELIVVDDGSDTISDLLPSDSRVRYWRLPQKLTVGAKRNYACAQASGEYIIHWDDDDWYGPDRVWRQIEPLLHGPAQVSGSSTFYFYDQSKRRGYRYQFNSPRNWVGGTTLAYAKTLWKRNAFECIQVGEDTRWLARVSPDLIHDLRDPSLCVASIHSANVSPKIPSGVYWTPEPAEKIEALLHLSDERPNSNGVRSTMDIIPKVTCIMPTYNRRAFIPLSLACFQSQTYANKELLIVDDGDDAIGDLVEHVPNVRYLRLERRISIGTKRNLACEQAAGAFIAHWDDDDWYSPQRLQHQMEPLLADAQDITGLTNSFVLQMPAGQFWATNDSVHKRMFVGDLHGGTLVFRRSLFLEGIRYPEVDLAEDAAFLRRAGETGKRIQRLTNSGLFIYMRHGRNSWKFECGRFLDPSGWREASAPAGFAPAVMDAYRSAVQQNA